MMGDVIFIESDESENSIVELEVPRKPTPPLIHIEEEEDIILNIMHVNRENITAKDFIDNDKILSVASEIPQASSHLNNPSHWTTNMIKFYDDDWGDEENFIVEKIQEKMDKSPSLWDVSRRETVPFERRIRKYWQGKKQGYFAEAWPDKHYLPKCHMCGTEGHVDHTCPNSKCLNCGNQSREFVTCCYKCRKQESEQCSRCQLVGHNFINCSDHWRLFHLTTGTTSVIVPDKNVYKPNKDIWCCNCGRRGHHNFQCLRKKDFGVFLDTLPFVSSYQKAFKDNYPNKDNYPQVNLNVKPKKKRRKRKSRRDRLNQVEKTLQINPLHTLFQKKNNPNMNNFHNRIFESQTNSLYNKMYRRGNFKKKRKKKRKEMV